VWGLISSLCSYTFTEYLRKEIQELVSNDLGAGLRSATCHPFLTVFHESFDWQILASDVKKRWYKSQAEKPDLMIIPQPAVQHQDS
jgi:hypothetical protein